MRYLSNDKLRSGLPLGGIGAGKIEILPNGGLDFFTFANNFDKPITDNPHPNNKDRSIALGVLGYHFAIYCKDKRRKTARLLQTAKVADYPTVKRIEFEGLFPIARLKYLDDKLPCKVSLEAFSPFIPGDSRPSATPGVIFEFTIHNPTNENLEVSLLSLVRNPISPYWCVGRYNKIKKTRGFTAIECRKEKPLASDYTNGTFFVGIPDYCGEITYHCQWNLQTGCFNFNRENVKIEPWEGFAETGRLSNADMSTPAQSENVQTQGALCCRINLASGKTKKIRVIYSWYFTHPERSHIYERWLKDAEAVAAYLEKDCKTLRQKTLAWHKSIYRLKGPDWLKDAVINNCYPFFSASWWDKKDRFSISEAPCDITLMGTLDVRYYDSVLRAKLFPDLEKKELMQFARAQRPSGYIPHDLGRGRIDLPSNGTTFYLWRDLNPKFILMAYRNFLWHKDRAELKRLYPYIKKAFSWILSTDKNRDFLPDNDGLDQTYDVWEFHGTNSYTSGIFLASLLALERIAGIIGDKKLSEDCRSYFERGRQSFQRQLWNGRYFIACNGAKGKDTACTLGQLNGQWYAHLLGLGYIVDKEKVKAAIKSILSLNVKDTKLGATNSVFSDEKRDRVNIQSQNLWAGEVYAFCALAVYEGFVKEGLEIAKRMWDNISRNQLCPWDQSDMLDPDTGKYLFGDHYMRNMVLASLLFARNAP